MYIPKGWRLVPETPTEEMLSAFNSMALCQGYIEEGYQSMLDAAPKYPVERMYFQTRDKPMYCSDDGVNWRLA